MKASDEEEDFLKNREYIYNLETEIKRAISKHSAAFKFFY